MKMASSCSDVSTTDNEPGIRGATPRHRHCALCLKTLSQPETVVKLCGGCRKRAYCSKECQRNDWKDGQGHKNWCKLDCGEEDVDWEVVSCGEKGLGLRAMREFKALSRIMVDGIRELEDPVVADLMPLEGSALEKFHLNALGCGEMRGSVLCARIARANHACDNNANHFYDETFEVKILFAERDIQKDEEICINYIPFTDYSESTSSPIRTRTMLQAKWGIACPVNCFCYDDGVANLVEKAKQLDAKIIDRGYHRKFSDALEAVERLLEICDLTKNSWINKKRTCYDGFQMAITRKRTLALGQEYMRKVYNIQLAIFSPKSAETLRYKELLEDPSKHRNYLIG